MKGCLILLVCTCSLIISLLARGQIPAPANAFAGLTYNLTISSTETWVDTRIDLHPGDALQINAVTSKGGCSPTGVKTSQNDTLPLNTALPGALIGKLSADGTPFFVGSRKELNVVHLEHLYLGLNSSGPLPCTGDILVGLRLISTSTQATATAKSKLAAAAQTWLSGQFGTDSAKPASTAQGASAASDASARSASESPATATVRGIPALKGANVPLDTELCKKIDALPRRVNDQFHNLGDMVNFVIVGSEQQMQSGFEAAGWRLADKSVEEAVINVVLVTYQKKDYLQMPMSTLYLFNRPQDFGYEQAEAYSVVASRHHFRLWKAPFTWNGQLVWVGAGTHDIGFEKDQRNGKVTHKIDPAVDRERDYISETLRRTGKIKSMTYHLSPNPIYDARNATGASYRSDGRLLVIFLQ
jgi:LssY-like putative type I secretion system component LssY